MYLDEIQLPDDLEWEDEVAWSPIVQNVERSVTGALFLQESQLSYGRPITLTSTSDMAWITREVVEDLVAKRNIKGLTMILRIGRNPMLERTFRVKFRQSETPIDVRPMRRGEAFESGTWYMVNAIRLMEVE